MTHSLTRWRVASQDDEILDRPYASWRARYDTPTRWRYWRSKYDPYYDPLTDPLALDYRRDALLPPPPRVPADWSWQLDEVTWAGRRLLLDAATGLVYEEANPGAMLWSVGRLALGQVRVAALETLALQVLRCGASFCGCVLFTCSSLFIC